MSFSLSVPPWVVAGVPASLPILVPTSSFLKVDSFPWCRLFIKIFNSTGHTTSFLGTPHYKQSDLESLPHTVWTAATFCPILCFVCLLCISLFQLKFQVACEEHLAKIKHRLPHPLTLDLCLPVIYKFLAIGIFCHLAGLLLHS